MSKDARTSFTYNELETMVNRPRLPANLPISAVKETFVQFDEVWDSESGHLRPPR